MEDNCYTDKRAQSAENKREIHRRSSTNDVTILHPCVSRFYAERVLSCCRKLFSTKGVTSFIDDYFTKIERKDKNIDSFFRPCNTSFYGRQKALHLLTKYSLNNKYSNNKAYEPFWFKHKMIVVRQTTFSLHILCQLQYVERLKMGSDFTLCMHSWWAYCTVVRLTHSHNSTQLS